MTLDSSSKRTSLFCEPLAALSADDESEFGDGLLDGDDSEFGDEPLDCDDS